MSKDSYVTPELETFFSDIVYTCDYRGKRRVAITITFLYEHKSQPDKYIHLQLLK